MIFGRKTPSTSKTYIEQFWCWKYLTYNTFNITFQEYRKLHYAYTKCQIKQKVYKTGKKDMWRILTAKWHILFHTKSRKRPEKNIV